MNIDRFRTELLAIFEQDDETGLYEGLDCDPVLYIHKDGCLGCSFDGYLIPCEGRPWGESLDVIIEHIRKIKDDSQFRATLNRNKAFHDGLI